MCRPRVSRSAGDMHARKGWHSDWVLTSDVSIFQLADIHTPLKQITVARPYSPGNGTAVCILGRARRARGGCFRARAYGRGWGHVDCVLAGARKLPLQAPGVVQPPSSAGARGGCCWRSCSCSCCCGSRRRRIRHRVEGCFRRCSSCAHEVCGYTLSGLLGFFWKESLGYTAVEIRLSCCSAQKGAQSK